MILGITGPMGSGKSYICNIFKSYGVPIYNSDDRVKWLYNNHQELKNDVINQFGDVYTDSKIDIIKMRKLVFSESSGDNLKKLTNIVNPYVKDDFISFYDANCDSPLIIIESAILFESGFDEMVDEILYILVSEDVRIKRALDRDSYLTREEYLNRMKYQVDERYKISNSDFVINNNNDINLEKDIQEIYKNLSNAIF